MLSPNMVIHLFNQCRDEYLAALPQYILPKTLDHVPRSCISILYPSDEVQGHSFLLRHMLYLINFSLSINQP